MTANPSYYNPAQPVAVDSPVLHADLCIYTANAAGVIAAVQAKRMGLTVALLNPAQQVGGLTSAGLSFTDIGNKTAIGGLARDFYRRLGRHYGKAEEWCFEPHIAERELLALLAENAISVHHGHYLDSVQTTADADGEPRIKALRTTSGLRVSARYFIDCSYEGDLMAAAGVSYTVGRESNSQYGERSNGQQVHATHQFPYPIDPYVRAGDPASGLLPGIDADSAFIPGAGDHRVQAYCFRMCMSRQPGNRVPFPKPAGYNRADYELLARMFAKGWNEVFNKFDRIQNDKTDTNNFGAVSTDYIGGNWGWPEGDHTERERIFQDHVRWQQGFHWFMANDPAVPASLREQYAQWGLAADEFTATANWPHQLYIREGRRMVADTVMLEHHCRSHVIAEDSVGLAAYTMDSHHCRRFVCNGAVLNEGDVQVALPRPYRISYRAIVPRDGECANLAVPVCLSASHIAFGSIRMEPVFMLLAQSAATAVGLAAQKGDLALQALPYAELQARLSADGQTLHPSSENSGSANAKPGE